MAEPRNVFHAADGTCISKPHLVLDKVHAIGIRTRVGASKIGRWHTEAMTALFLLWSLTFGRAQVFIILDGELDVATLFGW